MKIFIPEGEYIPNSEAAKMIGVSSGTVSLYVRLGKLNSIQLISGRKTFNLFATSEIERFLNESKKQSIK